MNEPLNDLRSQLRQHSDETLRAGAQRYFKEPVECYGIKTMTNTLISKKAVMPRTAYRYAIEKMPEEMKKRAMVK